MQDCDVANPALATHKVRMARRASFQPQTDPKAPPRACAAPGCVAAGEFRAPKDRALREYLWFCLEHVRQYNAGWDFYRGMGAADIETSIRSDTGWQRPTWPLGRLGGVRLDADQMADPLGILRDTGRHEKRRAPPRHEAPPELRAALGLLDLEWPLDPATLKSRYKELAKRYHPDANGGDRSDEEKLKDINRAYSLLRQRVGRAESAAQHAAHAG
ncbi:MAG: molecular chaperone DnaJ [Rubritepida sp.]|nr:molecular chaperone DnaJ [Rubritepida sp.]